ncbi:TPA: hypothetical protein N0F65_008176 [Lagenidium giganteum]|uniref:Uncharacterized protein n=1 Tax=Lagenidium giganteum TaxID=4803 RepID=A0AAV2YK51_9STRA|nr:TPA: hypothetical protein N0F65_008176 [Lagenidium giganteum]
MAAKGDPVVGAVPYAEVVLTDDAAPSKLEEHAKVSTKMTPWGEPKKPVDLVTVTVVEDGKEAAAASKEPEKKSVWLLIYCFAGIMVSFTLNGLVLEKMTNHRVMGELSLTFVFCLFYSVVALGLRAVMKEKPTNVPQWKLGIVGLLAFGSTISSMVALRYVTFITRILGKSCKSIPVMLMGVCLGKKYAIKKYLSVVILSVGVAVFLVGTAHEKQARAAQSNEVHTHQEHGKTPNLFLGFSLLMVSLVLDGATGALEDKFLAQYHVGAFDLMYTVNIWKSGFAALGMVVNGELPSFMEHAIPSLPNLLLLSATGALGQAFIFFTISKFGALTTSIIGTCRKVLSIVLSVILFGHILSAEQFLGLAVAFLGIGFNWIRFDACFKSKASTAAATEARVEEANLLDSNEDTADSEEDELSDSERETLAGMQPQDELLRSKEQERGLELVNVWHRTHHEVATPTGNRAAEAV